MNLYIANRGEIARRIIRTARRMGFRTFVGYATQDRFLPFVKEADVAIDLEGEESKDTYLNQEKILKLCRDHKIQFFHPGYGFLSENAAFVDRLIGAGVQFVGPPPQAMRLLGDKIGSRRFLKDLGIPLLPFYDGNDQSEARLFQEAIKLGFPLLIKPSAGGGGKGMFKIDHEDQFLEALRSSKRLAASSFGDDRVFLEKYIARGRHIEVQAMRDTSGQTFIFGERECSVQRAHQKIIEESPCQFLSEKIRRTIYDSSKKMADASGYLSAGTIEWIWDGAEGIYFLEVNARLQVEHPVTELVWNIDLVEAQLRVALGEKLSYGDLSPSGHAVELRLCAEDPSEGFMPSGGKIHKLSLPPGVRCDFGYVEKDSVPSQFDSLIGKIILFGKSRDEALQLASESLKQTVLLGPKTNRAYLLQLVNHPKVRSGELWTKMLDEIPYRFSLRDGIQLLKLLKAQPVHQELVANSYDELDWYSPWGQQAQQTTSSVAVEFCDAGDRRYFHTPFFDWSTRWNRSKATLSSSTASAESAELRCPLPARLVKILFAEGAEVKKGDVVMILEAMKMEIKVKSPRSGKIKKVLVKEGDRISVDALLVEWENK